MPKRVGSGHNSRAIPTRLLSIIERSSDAGGSWRIRRWCVDDAWPDRLIAEARFGDDAVRGRLLDLYRNYLRLVARSLIGGALRVQLDPSDLVQETFLKAHRDFGRFAAGRSESWWHGCGRSWCVALRTRSSTTAARRATTSARNRWSGCWSGRA